MTTMYSNRTSEASEVDYVGNATRHRFAVEDPTVLSTVPASPVGVGVSTNVSGEGASGLLKGRMPNGRKRGRRSWKRKMLPCRWDRFCSVSVYVNYDHYRGRTTRVEEEGEEEAEEEGEGEAEND
jgi:hypothetical protein